jgi:hypothetical protein
LLRVEGNAHFQNFEYTAFVVLLAFTKRFE